MRLVFKQGPLKYQTIALAVLPLVCIADDFSARTLVATTVAATFETPSGQHVGELELAAQLFSGMRTRSIVNDAVHRMRLMAAARSQKLMRAPSAAPAHCRPARSADHAPLALSPVRSAP